MKKIFIPIFILTFVLILSGIWIIEPGNNSGPLWVKYVFIGIIILFFSLGIYFAYQRIKRKKQGFPEDDELSIKVSRDAASISYYISLFLWLILIFIQNRIIIDFRWILAIGVIGMSLIYVFNWVIINNRGVINEKQD